MDYEALRLRLNGLLRAILEQDTRDFSERPSLVILGIGTLPYGEYCNHNSNIDHLRECPAYTLLYQFSPKDTGQSKVK